MSHLVVFLMVKPHFIGPMSQGYHDSYVLSNGVAEDRDQKSHVCEVCFPVSHFYSVNVYLLFGEL